MVTSMVRRKLTTESFVDEAKVVHGSKYDYSKTDYVNSRTLITVNCKVHGDFTQSPYSHLRGSGCSKCYFDSKKTTPEQFIAKVKVVHGDRYLYHKTKYETAQKKIIVTCPEHGDFLVRAGHHLDSKVGCRQCFFNSRRSDLDGIIKRAKEVHGDTYDYSKTQYVISHEQTIITCLEHGDFEMSLTSHLSGHGCPTCGLIKSGLSRRSNTEEFIAKAKTIHGDRYDYRETIYIGNKSPVKIKCSEHGMYAITPERHLNGSGCQVCGKELKSAKRRSNTEEFISKAKAVHGDLYEYNKVDYFNKETKVLLTCRKHGLFRIRPSNHLAGQGCRKCAQEKSITGPKLTLEDFIDKANKVHNNSYDYSKVVYVNSKTKVIIICPIHGEFNQSPSSHLSSSKCPRCKASKGELVISGILEKANIDFQTEFKPPESITRHRYDFYLPSCNLLIEFHGIQHYEQIPFFGGEESLKETKFRDAYKRDFAKLAGYNYLEFNYKQLKHLTEEAFEKLVLRFIYKHLNHTDL